MKIAKFVLLLFITFIICSSTKAEPLRWQNDKISWTVYNDDTQVLLKAELFDGWHISWKNPGEAGTPVEFKWEKPSGWQVWQINQSTPEKFFYEEVLNLYGYGKTAFYLFKIDTSKAKQPSENYLILNLNWTICKDYCQPENAKFILTDLKGSKDPQWPEILAQAEETFPRQTNWSWKANINENTLQMIISTDKMTLNPAVNPIEFIPWQRDIISAAASQKIVISGNHTLQIETESEDGRLPEQGGLLIYGDTAFSLPPLNTEDRLPFSLLLTAFLAGIILNLMPCVFPVLSLKALSLSQNKTTSAHVGRAFMYLSGVVCCFITIAYILYLLRISGESIGWGFQLQSPWFVGSMLIIFGVIFLMMIDVIRLNGSLAGIFDRLSRINSFLTGFFAVLIASPCTGPLMGAVLGYALLQPAQIYFPIFLALGIGYALPFTLIELFPKMISALLPKPGKWMQRLKYILSVPVFITCVWLGWVLYHQVTADEDTNDLWQPYDRQAIDQLIDQHRPVFIDFTAKWCITCLVNEKTTLFNDDFEKTAQKNGVALFKADWTNREDMITDALQSYGRGSVPLYVFYPADSHGKYIILPQLLTPEMVMEYLRGQNQNNN